MIIICDNYSLNFWREKATRLFVPPIQRSALSMPTRKGSAHINSLLDEQAKKIPPDRQLEDLSAILKKKEIGGTE